MLALSCNQLINNLPALHNVYNMQVGCVLQAVKVKDRALMQQEIYCTGAVPASSCKTLFRLVCH